MIGQVVAAFLGTVTFALMCGVPRKYRLHCGICGGAGWWLYLLLEQSGCTVSEATFFAAVLIIVLARFCAVLGRCPATVFVISGIIPLVPGAGVYWMVHYLVLGRTEMAWEYGFAAVKTAVAIVLGIVLVFELPQSLFRIRKEDDNRKGKR